MKKFFTIVLFLLLFHPAVLANENATAITTSTIEVRPYGQENNTIFGLKTQDGKVITEPIYKKLIKLGDNAWISQIKNKYGIIDNNGNVLVKHKYRHAERLFTKYAKLGNSHDYGLYNEFGESIIKPEFSKIEPLFGQMFLTCKKHKYGIIDISGKQLIENRFDDIYMPTPKALRIKHEGEWYQIERLADNEIELPEGVKKIKIEDKEYKVTHLINNTGIMTGYSALTATDYFIKLFSSISPAYEETIDELMLSHGTDTISIFMKLSWLPKFPVTYAQKYYNILTAPNNGPLSDVRTNVKKQLK